MLSKYRLTFDRALFWSLVKERTYMWFLLSYTAAVIGVISQIHVLLPDKIRFTGVTFNLTAIVVAAVMLLRGVYKYKVLSVFGSWGIYFARFFPVFFRPRVINLEAHMSAGSAVGVGLAVARAPLHGSADEKLAQLDQRTRNIESRFDTLQGAFNKQGQEFEDRLKKERAERSQDSHAIQQLVRESLFGDHGWELVVAMYLVFGLVANVPNEVAKYIFSYAGPWQ